MNHRIIARPNRRGFLQIGGMGMLGLSLAANPRLVRAAESRAKSAILVFLTGGPSHHDTFDPKPDAPAAFDLTQEDPKTRERYGRTQFGQRLLLARRLVEAGVPFLAATDFEWDDHSDIFPKLKQKLPIVDRGLSALVADLDERGLLAETLVIVMGEFGRTPKVNALKGRDHWPNCFSVLLAGGGVRGGQVIGESDAEGAFPQSRPITPEELFHSIYVLLGIDPLKLLASTGGREIEIVRDGKFIQELTG